MKLIKTLALAAALAAPATAALAIDRGLSVPRPNVLEVAVISTNFETLLVAANNAGLIGRLADPAHRVTLLAPSDDAFAKLPKGTIEKLLDPRNRDQLAAFVGNHIIPSGVLSAQFADQSLELATLSGKTVKLSGATAGDAKIEYSDVVASNGVIHVIDKVLMPGS